MARTYRNLEGNTSNYFRKPKTANERKHIIGLINDSYVEGYEISGLNHLHHRLANCPTSWEDKVVSGYYQEDHKAS